MMMVIMSLNDDTDDGLDVFLAQLSKATYNLLSMTMVIIMVMKMMMKIMTVMAMMMIMMIMAMMMKNVTSLGKAGRRWFWHEGNRARTGG